MTKLIHIYYLNQNMQYNGFLKFSALILNRENLSTDSIRTAEFWEDLINFAIDLDEESTLEGALSRLSEFYENVLQELVLGPGYAPFDTKIKKHFSKYFPHS